MRRNKEIAYLKSLGFKWLGKRPKASEPGVNPKHEHEL